MTDELKLWRGKFGDSYKKRNELRDEDISARENMWRQVFNNSNYDRDRHYQSDTTNVLEVGCGQGINLIALSNITRNTTEKTAFFGIDPNEKSRKECIKNCDMHGFKPTIKNGCGQALSDIDNGSMDLVFTSGVLIHIKPEDQLSVMKQNV